MIKKFLETKIPYLGKDSIKGHSLISFVLNGVGIGFLFLQQIIFTRVLSTEQFGQFSFISSIFIIGGIFSKWGMISLSSRELNRLKTDSEKKGFYFFSLGVILLFSTGLGVFLYLGLTIGQFNSKYDYIIPVLLVAVFWFMLKSVLELWAVQFQARKLTPYAKLTTGILPPIFVMTVTLLFYYFFNQEISLQEFYTSLAIGLIITIVVVIFIKKPGIFLFPKIKPVFHSKIWLKTGWYLLLLSSMRVLMKKINVLLVGYYEVIDQVGFYNVAITLSGLALFGLTATNQVIAPLIAKSYYDKNERKFENAIRMSTKIGSISTIVLSIPLLIWGNLILKIYGEAYVEAYIPMVIVVLAQIFSSLCGPVGYSLTMSGNEKVVLGVLAIALVINIVLAVVFIPSFGIIGAAIANAISIVFWNLILVIYTNSKLGYDTSVFSIIRSSK